MSSIAREHIDPDADKVVRRLKRHGFEAYLVGGCVRDLLLGRRPKDFDVATSATPPETKDLFRNCRIIGRRFRLAHIFFGSKIIETSTFRQNPREGVDIEEVEELLIRRDNVFGTAEEDARRRDFTINGLFYDVEAEQVIDYVGGRADLEARLIRTIGDPDIRFREDPVRILRAIKFAARLDFEIEPATYAAILTHRVEIPKCAAPRVLEEVYRLLRGGAARRSIELLLTTGVAATLSPELAWMFGGEAAASAGLIAADLMPVWLTEDPAAVEAGRARAWRMLDILDAFGGRAAEPVYEGQPSNALLIALLVAPFMPELFAPAKDKEDRMNDLSDRIESLIKPLSMRLRVSRRDAERARQVLLALRRLVPGRRRRARPMALVRRDYFPEALATYELLLQGAGDDEQRDEIGRWKAMWRSAYRQGERRGDDRHERRPPREGEPRQEARPAGDSDAPRPIWDNEAEGDSDADAEVEVEELLEGAPSAEGTQAPGATPGAPGDATADGGRRRRRRRRGGRRRRRPEPGATPLAETTPSEPVAATAAQGGSAREDAGE